MKRLRMIGKIMNYYDLLKYVHTGIAAPDMTYYDRIRGDALRESMIRRSTQNSVQNNDSKGEGSARSDAALDATAAED